MSCISIDPQWPCLGAGGHRETLASGTAELRARALPAPFRALRVGFPGVQGPADLRGAQVGQFGFTVSLLSNVSTLLATWPSSQCLETHVLCWKVR